MNRLFLILLLIGLILLCGGAGASNLTLEKTVDTTTYLPGENITWILTLTNNNDTPETGIRVTEHVPPGCTIKNYLSHNGTVTNDIWAIDLDAGVSEILKFNMSCTQACGSRVVENIANITSPDPGLDDNPFDNNASETVMVNAVECTSSNLTLKKTVLGSSEYNLTENITWLVEVTNNNATDSLPVNVTEHLPVGCSIRDTEVSAGIFAGSVWSLPLAAGANETLRMNVSCTQICGSKTIRNIANITSPIPGIDDNPIDNNASSAVMIHAPECVNTTVRPITLNLKSKGVLTVFFTIGGQLTAVEEGTEEDGDDDSGLHINRENSSLICNGVNPNKILFSMKNGGTVMGKFQRQALALEAADGTAQLDCEGMITLSDGRNISIQGNDTLHVIHAEATQKQSLIQRIFAFLGFTSGSGTEQSQNIESVITNPGNTDEVKNLGQLKKILKTATQEDESDRSEDIEVLITTSGKSKSENPGNGNGKKDNPSDQNKGKGKGNY